MGFKKCLFVAFGVTTIFYFLLPNVVKGGHISSTEEETNHTPNQDENPPTLSLNSFEIQSPCCKNGPPSNPYLLLLSTLDGHITALNVRNGEVVWSLQTDAQPLFSSTLGNIDFSSGDRNYRLIPSLDGNFYMYNDAIAQGIPISAETLLSSSMKFGSDIISGGKDVRTFGVNYNSGQLHYTFTLNNRESYADQSEIIDNLVIKRITQTVRAVEASSGTERWNVTVGEHHLLLTEKESSCFCPTNYMTDADDYSDKNLIKPDDSYEFRISPADGIINVYDRSDPYMPIWQKKLDSPIAQLWKISENNLHEISLFDSKIVPFLPAPVAGATSDMTIYIGTYENEKYVIPSPDEKERLKLMVAQHTFFPSEPGRLFLAASSFDLRGSEPKISSADGSCFDECPTCSSEEVNALILRDQYPKDMGWYLFKHHDKTINKNLPQLSKRNSNKVDLNDRFLFSWIHMIFLFVGATGIFSAFIYYSLRKLRSIDSTFQPNDANMVATVSVKSQVTETELGIENVCTPAEYNSLFLEHFEPLRCLGKGGFGVVIESLNKLDQQKYAVKRISVSNKPDGKDRVQREVRALAKLDHPGIVRYYSTWLEEPPPNWQEVWDKEFSQRSQANPCMSVDVAWSTSAGGDVNESETNLKMIKDISTLSSLVDKKLGISWNNSFMTESNVSQSKNVTEEKSSSTATNFNLGKDIGEDQSLEIIFASKGEEADKKSPSTSKSSWSEIVKRRVKRHTLDIADKQLQTNENHNQRKAYLYIQMQLCQDQTLSKWMKDHCRQCDRDRGLVLDWYDQIVCAVQYVHDSNLIHRDLKPSNIFFAQNGQLKIGDFGLAKGFAVEEIEYDDGSQLTSTIHRSTSHTDNVGTWLYMSPEQEHGDSYTFKVDIYALGLIFVELLLPFSTEMERRNVLRDLKNEKFPKDFEVNFPEEFDLAKSLLSHNPDERPICKKIRECDIFACIWSVRSVMTSTNGRTTARNCSSESRNSSSGGGGDMLT